MKASDVRAEHDRDWASLTPGQRKAVERVFRASIMGTFSGATAEGRLDILCAAEARVRSA